MVFIRPVRRPGLFVRTVGVTAIALGLASGASAKPTLEESFEFFDDSGAFTVGTPPFTLTFEGGISQDLGRPELVYDGTHAWMIPAGSEGHVTFGYPAENVRFQVRKEPGMGSLVTEVRVNGRTNTTSIGNGYRDFSMGIPVLGAVARVEITSRGDPGQFVTVDFFRYRAACGVGMEEVFDGMRPVGDVVLCLRGCAEL